MKELVKHVFSLVNVSGDKPAYSQVAKWYTDGCGRYGDVE